MKRRLINYDVFEKMRDNSLSTLASELVEAEPIFAQALSLSNAKLNSFDTETALYETVDGKIVRANYKVDNKRIVFENIEQLVIDEETEKIASKKVISEMLDALLQNQEKKAETLFSDYMNLPVTRRSLNESKKCEEKDSGFPFKKKKKGKDDDDEDEGSNKKDKDKDVPPFFAKKGKDEKEMKKCVKEWANLCQNVLSYLNYIEFGPTLKESTSRYDEKGNIVALSIPTVCARNEAKLLSFDWDVPKTQVKLLRMKCDKLCENMDFCKAVAQLKRFNAVSDNDALEEALENIVGKWPEVLYLTQDELSKTIKIALETIGATNYDDSTCDFMSEGILRMAHGAYVDRVNKILRLAGTEECEGEDKYGCFQEIVKQFYPSLDEAKRLEMQVFVDLYEALRTVHEMAIKQNNTVVLAETVGHLNDLVAIIRKEIEPSIDVAEDAAYWLSTIVETNIAGNDWNVSNSTFVTLTGEHPQMAKNAKVGYTPASDFSGDWGDVAPASDGKSYKGGEAEKMRNSSYGNLGGNDTYPNLKNPYIQKPFGDYKIKGEKHVDADSATGQWSSGDTWPTLQNPYVPKSVVPKLNQGKEEDAVANL